MTTISIKENIKLPKNIFENLSELLITLESIQHTPKKDVTNMSLKEYIQSGAIDEDETLGPFEINKLIEELNK